MNTIHNTIPCHVPSLPHQPRLDWQMWFAALSSPGHQPWLLALVWRLLEGRTEVLGLLDPDTPWAGA